MDLLALNVPPHAILSLLREVSDKIPFNRNTDVNENLPVGEQIGGRHT